MIFSSPPLLTHLIDTNDQRNGNKQRHNTRNSFTPMRPHSGGSMPTSSKYLSTILAGKRPRAEVLEEEDELDADEPLAPNTTEREQIE